MVLRTFRAFSVLLMIASLAAPMVLAVDEPAPPVRFLKEKPNAAMHCSYPVLYATLWDYGDAPDHLISQIMPAYTSPSGSITVGHFTTRENSDHTAAAPGARHRVTSVGWLGGRVSAEQGVASGYDSDRVNNFIGNSADFDQHDDGLSPATFTAGVPANVRFTVTATSGLSQWYVNALVDWNFDGWWYTPAGGADEWAIRNMPISVAPRTTGIFSAPVTPGMVAGSPWVRLTLSNVPIVATAGDEAFTGNTWNGAMPQGIRDAWGDPAFPCGETEDSCGILQVNRVVPTLEALQETVARATRCPTPVGKG